jgi:hypothetical protein
LTAPSILQLLAAVIGAVASARSHLADDGNEWAAIKIKDLRRFRRSFFCFLAHSQIRGGFLPRYSTLFRSGAWRMRFEQVKATMRTTEQASTVSANGGRSRSLRRPVAVTTKNGWRM